MNSEKRQPFFLVLAALIVFVVFAQPQPCAEAAHAALQLCGGPLLLGIFPFLLVSQLIIASNASDLLSIPLRPLARLLHCKSAHAPVVLLVGLLGGFAPAAATLAGLYRQHKLPRHEAEMLLAAAVNSSPAFVILSVGLGMLRSISVGIRLFCSQILASWLLVFLGGALFRPQKDLYPSESELPQSSHEGSFSALLAACSLQYITLCGCVLFFRLLAGGIGAFLPTSIQFLPALLLEVSSGCNMAAQIPLYGTALCCAALSLQGASVFMQVHALCGFGLSLRWLFVTRFFHLPLALALFRLISSGTQEAAAYSSLENNLVILRRDSHSCALLLFFLCVMATHQLCGVTNLLAQQTKKHPAKQN